MSIVQEKALKVYQWASQLTAESLSKEEKYYQTKFFKLLTFKIHNTPHALIGIVGLQGSGKSRLLIELQSLFKESLYFKWSRDWLTEVQKWEWVYSKWMDALYNEADSILEEYFQKGMHHPALIKYKHVVRDTKKENIPFAIVEKIVGKETANQTKQDFAMMLFQSSSVILIDMPDYNKYNPSAFNLDFEELQKFWSELQSSNAKFVIALQKELIMKHPHFFIGKMDVMELDLLTADELVEAYNAITEDKELFSPEALRLIAELSRGVFRRFKKYIRITIEQTLKEKIPIQLTQVKSAITDKILFADLELELTDILKDRAKRIEAVKILSFLRDNKNVNIKTISEAVNLTETIVQKLIRTLQTYNYVTVTRGKGKESLITLC